MNKESMEKPMTAKVTNTDEPEEMDIFLAIT